MGTWVYRYMGIWVHGCMGTWVYGYMGTWLYAGVHGCDTWHVNVLTPMLPSL